MKMIFHVLFFLTILSLNAKSHQQDIAICAIFQNEDRFLDEWISYHRKIGVSHFYLYNNGSEDNYRNVLEKYINLGVVDLIEWPSNVSENEWENFSFTIQTSAYNDAIERCKRKTKWLAIIDTDEFIFPIKQSLQNILHKYEDNASICLKWACFGTSNMPYCESGKMLENLLWRLPLHHARNNWYKSIVKPKKVEKCTNPHFCVMKKDEKTKIIDCSEARLNHYWTRDEMFFQEVKVPRYIRWGKNIEEILLDALMMNQEFDDSINDYLGVVKT